MGVQILRVPHLGGIDVAYQMPHGYDRKKPTLLLVHSFLATSDQYQPQFGNKELTDAVNLIAVDLLGHGQTRTKSENYTYWDSTYMIIQLLDALTIGKFYVLGTSQGGWVTARLALLAPTRVGNPCSSFQLECRLKMRSRFKELSPWEHLWILNRSGPESSVVGIQDRLQSQ